MKKITFLYLFLLLFPLIIPVLSVNAQQENWVLYEKGLFGNIYQNSLNPNEFRAYVSSDLQNYFLNNELEPINLNVMEINEGDYKYGMTKASYHAYFPEFLTHSPIKFTVGDNVYTWLIEEASYNASEDYLGNPNQSKVMLNQNNEVVYFDAFNGLDANIIYELTTSGLKEWIVLNSVPREPAEYLTDPVLCFGEIINFGDLNIYVDDELKTKSFVTSNKIEFKDDSGNILFNLPKPYAVDSSDPVFPSIIYLEYDIQIKGNKVWLYIKTPYSWLNDAETVYPVYIDASPETINAGWHVYAYDDGTKKFQAPKTALALGQYFLWAYCIPGIDFDTSIIPDTATITNVDFRAYVYHVHNGNELIDIDEMIGGDAVDGASKNYWDASDEAGFWSDAVGDSYLSNSTAYQSTGWVNVTLLDQAETDLEDQLDDDWFSLGMTEISGNNDYHIEMRSMDYNGLDPHIIVTFTLPNNTPTNDTCTITDMDDSDNLYAQKKLYTIDYDVTDLDGYADIDYAEARLKQGAGTRAIFRYDEDTDTFSVESGSSEWSLDGSSSASEGGNTIEITFKFVPQWDATEESDLEIECYVVDDEPESDTDTMQTNYADVITNLLVSGFACDDDRGNVSQSITFTGTVYFANNPASGTPSDDYPPNAEFSAVHIYDSGDNDKGNDNTITNGAFSVNFNAEATVKLETYNPYIDMADADYTDAEETPTDTFISDRIKILTLSANVTALAVDEYVLINATFELEYDNHVIGAGDSISLTDGVDSQVMSWNAGLSVWELEDVSTIDQTVIYNEFTGSEATHSITAVNIDGKSLSVRWIGDTIVFGIQFFVLAFIGAMSCFALLMIFGIKRRY